jgi:hypothetical protein
LGCFFFWKKIRAHVLKKKKKKKKISCELRYVAKAGAEPGPLAAAIAGAGVPVLESRGAGGMKAALGPMAQAGTLAPLVDALWGATAASASTAPETVAVVAFCAEGDNGPEGVQVARAVLTALELADRGPIKIPSAWASVARKAC